MKGIEVIFGLKNKQGRSFSGDLFFEDTRPEFKNIRLCSLGYPKIEKAHPDCIAHHREAKEFALEEHFEIRVTKRLMKGGQNEIRAIVEEASVEAERFYYAFSVVTNIKFFGFECLGYEEDGQRRRLEDLYPGIRLKGSTVGFHITTNTDAPSLIAAKERMTDGPDIARAMLFLDSANVSDPVARFISLYTVMLNVTAIDDDECQKYVDEAILEIDPHVSQSKKPKGNQYETLFTRLRNELSHKRPDANILKVHADVRMHVDRFEEVVKEHLLGAIPTI